MIKLAMPMALQNLISFLVTMVDTVMVGVLGDTALSAVSTASQPYLIFNTLIFGVSSGGMVLAAQYWGKKRTEDIRRVTAIVIVLGLMISLVFGGICFLFPKPILSLFSSDPAVIAQAVSYLKVMVFSYGFNAVSLCYLSILKATGNTALPGKIYLASLASKVILNYILILRIPVLGIKGAALATILSRILENGICLFYSRFEQEIGFRFSDITRISKELLPQVTRQCAPIILHELNWSVATTAQVAVIGHTSSLFLTAQSIALLPQDIAVAFLQGLAGASAVMIGNEIGKGKKENAVFQSRKLLLTALIAGILACLMILLCRNSFLLLYPNISKEGIALSRQLMTVLAFLSISLSVEYTCTIGILRGAGDTVFAFLADSTCMWLIGIPLGCLGAFVLHLPYPLIYLMLKADTVVKVFWCLLHMRDASYMKDVTEEKTAG